MLVMMVALLHHNVQTNAMSLYLGNDIHLKLNILISKGIIFI